MSGPSRTSAGLGRAITETDLDNALSTKIDTRAPQGRTAAAITALGAAGSITLTSDDDQGEVDIDVTLTADGVLTINGLATLTRVKVWVTAIQDGAGNHTLDVKNGTTGDQVTVTIDQTAAGRTLLLLKTNDAGQTLQVVDQSTVSSGGGSGTGIPNATITGTPGAGNTLTANPPAIFLASSLAYQWIASSDGGTTWAPISGATSQTYTQVSGDAGHKIDCQVSGTPMVTADSPVDVPSSNIAYVATAQQSTTSSTSLHALRPTGATDGDILFVEISVPSGATGFNVTIPATTGGTDWVAMGSGSGGTTAAGRYQDTGGSVWFLYWKRLAAGDATTTWSFTTGGTSVSYRSRCVAFRNAVSTGTPFEGFSQSFSASSTSWTAPTKTPGATNEMYVVSYGYNASFSTTFTPGLTLTQAAGSDYQNFAYALLATTSATGTTAATVSGAARKNIATWLITHA